jgi:two-component sensor histidine kinase/sensor domain CHASE-containing protein
MGVRFWRKMRWLFSGETAGPGPAMPILLFLVLVDITLVLWRVQRAQEDRVFSEKLALIHNQFAARLGRILDDQIRPLRRLQHDSAVGRLGDEADFLLQANSLTESIPTLRTIGRVDSQGTCQAVASTVGDRPLRGQKLTTDPMWGNLLVRAQRNLTGAVGVRPFSDVRLGQCLFVVVPIIAGERDASAGADGVGRYDGAIMARLQLNDLVAQSVKDDQHLYFGVSLWEGGKLILTSTRSDDLPSASPRGPAPRPAVLRVLDQQWDLRVQPAALFQATNRNHTSAWMLWLGLALSTAISAAVLQSSQHRRQQMERARQHLAALESLNEVMAAISGKLGSGQDLLGQLADAATRLLGMSMAEICLLDEPGEGLELVAVGGDSPSIVGKHRPLKDHPGSQRAMASGEVIFVEDVFKTPSSVSQHASREVGAAAVILIPLHVEGRAIGILALGDPRPHKFADRDVRLARLLGSQAAVTLTNHRLYERTRQAMAAQRELLEQREMLLRELQHRVKNNLAGIVGLLSMDQPPLSAEARHWIDRAIERIGTMARAQELFSSGEQEVGLEELVRQMLPSLSVVKPSAVSLRTELDPGGVQLRTERAVTLAMVLHELCYNAIVHGAGERRSVLVRSRRVGDQQLAIDVVEDGCRGSAGADTAASALPAPGGASEALVRAGVGRTGMGLKLVQGLVGRELGGRFTLQISPGGGSIATVEFPLRADEWRALSTAPQAPQSSREAPGAQVV